MRPIQGWVAHRVRFFHRPFTTPILKCPCMRQHVHTTIPSRTTREARHTLSTIMLRISHRIRLVNALGAQTSRQTKTLWKLLLTPLTGTALLAIMLPKALHPAPCELLTAAHSTQMALQRCVVCSPLGAAQVAALPWTLRGNTASSRNSEHTTRCAIARRSRWCRRRRAGPRSHY